MLLSIIIVARDKHSYTTSCLQSIRVANLPFEHEVILVDNASESLTQNAITQETFDFEHANLLRNEENLCFSKANNAATAEASGEFFLFLNNDVEVSIDAISKMLDLARGDESVGIVGAKLLYPETGIIQHAGIVHMLWGFGSNFGVGAHADERQLNRRREIFAVTGAMMLARRRTFEEINGFCEAYNWGYEDIDVCLKATRAGAKVVYEPEATAKHHESLTLSEIGDKDRDTANYMVYRQRWDDLLSPAEESLLEKYADSGVKRIVIYGTGKAARGLQSKLSEGGIETICFVKRACDVCEETMAGTPVLNLEEMAHLKFDRLFVGSQFYYQAKPNLLPVAKAESLEFPIAIR